jgi:hypothetical protein
VLSLTIAARIVRPIRSSGLLAGDHLKEMERRAARARSVIFLLQQVEAEAA